MNNTKHCEDLLMINYLCLRILPLSVHLVLLHPTPPSMYIKKKLRMIWPHFMELVINDNLPSNDNYHGNGAS